MTVKESPRFAANKSYRLKSVYAQFLSFVTKTNYQWSTTRSHLVLHLAKLVQKLYVSKRSPWSFSDYNVFSSTHLPSHAIARVNVKNNYFLPENPMEFCQFLYHSHGFSKLYDQSYFDSKSIYWTRTSQMIPA